MRYLALLIFICSFKVVAQNPTEGLMDVNGTKLWISVHGQGEPVVVLHGGPGLNHSYFKPHLAALEKNFSVIYYDQRACGQSLIPGEDSITMKLFVDDLEAIRKKFNIKKLNLLAHSWGAVLAAHYALTYPDNISKLVVSNPAMLSREYDEALAKRIKDRTTPEDSVARANLLASNSISIKQYEDFFMLSFKGSAYNPKNLVNLNLNLPDNFIEANKALFTGLMKDDLHSLNLYNSLGKLSFPVLIIHGEADIIPEMSIERLKTSLPNAHVIVFEKSGHFPFIEQTKKFNAVTISFFKEARKK
jgi:proline iminopeptidase